MAAPSDPRATITPPGGYSTWKRTAIGARAGTKPGRSGQYQANG